jgi:hypothetical protein
MIALPSGVQVWLACGHIDMRKAQPMNVFETACCR